LVNRLKAARNLERATSKEKKIEFSVEEKEQVEEENLLYSLIIL
jgi:hypothetical protein